MIAKNILGYKLGTTKDEMTAYAGMVLFGEFMRGLGVLDIVDKRMPKPGNKKGFKSSGKQIKYIRSDSAGYQGKIIDYCFDNEIEFAIGADLDKAVVGLINQIPEKQWRKYERGKISETVHTMNKNRYSFRLIVVSRPYQADVFGDVAPKCKFKVIATNRTEPAEWVVDWYNQRCECSENRIKDLKIGFGMERMPCGQFKANAVFFRIGVIAYNLYKLFVMKVLDKGWRKFQVQSVRWKLYQTAGKVVFHAGRVYLKISEEAYELFARIRQKSYEFVMS